MTTASDTRALDLRSATTGKEAAFEATVLLDAAQDRLRVRLPAGGSPGRAEATFDGKSWAAKHYWREGDEVVYAFDEPLPATEIRLRIPFAVP